ncbi:MAG TPA: protoglobin domain-containing protein [Hyphomicrobiales bacterium]|nr:protoglobin domain-containing protein [Hyphomicrobiales bacterium]
MDMFFVPDPISTATRDRLWALVGEDIEGILADFYDRLENSGHKLLLDRADVELLKHKQINHWRKLFCHPLDEEYARRLEQMHARHLGIGLSIGQYVTAYLHLKDAFQQAVLRQAAGAGEAVTLLLALNRIVSDDIVRALAADGSAAPSG